MAPEKTPLSSPHFTEGEVQLHGHEGEKKVNGIGKPVVDEMKSAVGERGNGSGRLAEG